MANITVQTNQTCGKMKPMNAVNKGPLGFIIPFQNRNNFEEYKAARIPYARNHDASEWIDYGGGFVVDIYSLFPNFDADPEDPANYEFEVTDSYTKFTQDAGTETFYRLGSRIEHQCKKYRTIMPRDFHKWAVICEHVIRHYTEGWANGFHYHIEYWEIWNEPDNKPDDTPPSQKTTWSGTAQQFYEFYEVVATYLKERFPHLKIGGPAIAREVGTWFDRFLDHMTRDGKHVPLDFFSWHYYGTDPRKLLNRAQIVRQKLDAAGYTETESILNEWNYVANWRERWVDTILTLISIKGASFIAASISEGQNSPNIDMMMYYDAAPCSLNGLFDFYTWKPIKGYWAIYAFSDLCELGTCIRTESDDKDIYVTASRDDDGNSAALITYYTDEPNREDKNVTIRLDGTKTSKTEIYTVDNEHNYELTATVEGPEITVTMQPNTFMVLKNTL